jgi:hypothetical protein
MVGSFFGIPLTVISAANLVLGPVILPSFTTDFAAFHHSIAAQFPGQECFEIGYSRGKGYPKKDPCCGQDREDTRDCVTDNGRHTNYKLHHDTQMQTTTRRFVNMILVALDVFSKFSPAEAMEQAWSYYNNATRRSGRAAKML